MKDKPEIILASTSHARIEILKKINFNFVTRPPNVIEKQLKGEKPENMSLRLSREKSISVAINNPNSIVIGSDQVAVCRGKVLSKPLTEENAIKQLSWQIGNKTEFYTGIAISRNGGKNIKSAVVKSYVEFLDKKHLSNDFLSSYVKKSSPLNCAGSAKFEGIGISLVKRVSSEDPNALMGLPVIKLFGFFNEWGYSPLSLVN